MSDGRLAFCFGVHNHQPVGQFDAVLREATARAYLPFLERLAARPGVRCALHWTGSLLEWLRYLIPFADIDASLAYLEARRGAAAALTVADDGEKLGAWPGTHTLVYGQGWLDRFFDRLLATPWLALATPGDVVASMPATGGVCLPGASYREMGEWALAPDAARELEAARRALGTGAAGARRSRLLRGGGWRAFVARYPEVGDTYWKMLRLSDAIGAARERDPLDPRLAEAQAALWRGQANDAYRHGVFGGCYLPHLRRAVRGALLEAERALAAATGAPPLAWARADVNGDGREEVVVRTPELVVTVAPALGGAVTEVGVLARALDLADVLGRRPEAYHDRAVAEGAAPPEYDEFRRASLLDGLFDAGAPLDALAPWPAARAVFACRPLRSVVDGAEIGVTVTMTPAGDDGPVTLDKRVTVRDASLVARYRLRGAGGRALPAGRWAVQWNLALTAGDAPGRYLNVPGQPSLASTGRRADLAAVDLVDEWIGVTARLEWTPAAELAWAPVETLSLSEAGAERLYQGLALLLVWPLDAGRGAQEMTTTLTVVTR